MKYTKQKQYGLTLVELLAVVIVIVVLIALIFPVLRGILQTAHNGRCLKNLKTIGFTAMEFMAEQPDQIVMPYLFWHYNSDNGRYEHDKSRGGESHWYAILADYGLSHSRDTEVFTCPAAEVQPGKSNPLKPGARMPTNPASWANYAWNSGINGRLHKNGDDRVRRSEVKASHLFLFADRVATRASQEKYGFGSRMTIGAHSYETLEQLLDPDAEHNFGFRHNGRANIFFLDGHIEALAPEEIPLKTKTPTEKYLLFYTGFAP